MAWGLEAWKQMFPASLTPPLTATELTRKDEAATVGSQLQTMACQAFWVLFGFPSLLQNQNYWTRDLHQLPLIFNAAKWQVMFIRRPSFFVGHSHSMNCVYEVLLQGIVSGAMMGVKFLFDARDACTCKSSLSKLLENGSVHASLERLKSTDASLLAL
jgi:hypothetical protein